MQTSEAQLIPYQASFIAHARTVVVFAPHPDDEVFGCGGALARHVQQGHRVHVVLLTAGGHGADDTYAQQRLAESAQAAQVLGLPEPCCWHLPDRQVRYGEPLIERMQQLMEELGADLVYAPSTWELHPDHRAASLAATEAVRRMGGDITLCLYEVSAPLRPNLLVDISEVWPAKQAAMQVFASQEEKLPYASFIGALNRFRALTLQPNTEYAEGFEQLRARDLQAGGVLQIASERERLLARGAAAVTQDEPLVSVIVRTMGRATLERALASVARQTYAHLEVVLVDAAGQGLADRVQAAGAVPCRVVNQGGRLARALAANAGLQAAGGEYLVFLDDDDWFYPDHIAKLVRAARLNPVFRAVHTAVECVDEAGTPTGEVFSFAYTSGELRYGNFLPIHSVLFQRSLVVDGCAFDPAFDLYEDWDFWLQVETRTALGFVAGVSAAYCIQAGSGEGVRVDAQRARSATAQLYAKWQVLQSAQTFDELITRSLARRSLLRQLDGVRREQDLLRQEAIQHQQLAQQQQQQALWAQQQADAARQDAHQLRQAHDLACMARDGAWQDLRQAWQRHAQVQEQWLHEHALCLQAQAQAQYWQQLAQQMQAELPLARDHANNLQRSLDAAQRDLAAVLASTSWRWSRPVRAVGRRLGTVRNALAALRITRGQGQGWVQIARRTLQVWRSEGLAGVRTRARRKLHPQASSGIPTSVPVQDVFVESAGPAEERRDYASWVARFDSLNEQDMAMLRRQCQALSVTPLVSVVMPVYNAQEHDLRRAVQSVRQQIYPNWELCICDDASTDARVSALLQELVALDGRIRLVRHAENRHISHASNSAIALAQGVYVAFLDQDDELRPHALLSAVQMFQSHPGGRVLYSDEDKIDQDGRRFDPYFKPDFNLGLLRSHNYMCHFAVYERDLLQQLGGLRPGFEGAQDYDLALRAVDAVGAAAVLHVPRVLYHWRTAVGSTASGHANKSYAFDAGKRALTEHLQRRGLAGSVQEAAEAPGMYRVRWQRPAPAPLVSIIIPTRNGHDILRQCLDSLSQTDYPHYEVIVVDNGSDDPAALQLLGERTQQGQIRVLRDDSAFNFSALNNRAVREMAQGEFVLLMNNDIEITHPQWLDEMVGAASEEGVGCVGARLWYPDGRLQHAGVVLVCGVAGHAHKFLARGQHGYMGRAVLAQDFVGVTAACLLVRRSIYDQVGGLDETLAVAFNDVDFCLRVHTAGYRNHWTPHAELVHHESVSRGYEDTPEKQKRFKREIDILQSRWSNLLAHDPCYSPNLTANAEDFSLAWPPKAGIDVPL